MTLKKLYIKKYKTYHIWSYIFQYKIKKIFQLTQSFKFYYNKNLYLKNKNALQLFFKLNCLFRNFITYQHNFIILTPNYTFSALSNNLLTSNFNCLIARNKIELYNINFFKYKFINKQFLIPTYMINLAFIKKAQTPVYLPYIGSYNQNIIDFPITLNMNCIINLYFIIKYLLKICFSNWIWI